MLSNTCKYAIRALIYLGKYYEEGTKIGIKKISSDLNIPTPFLGKILQNLVKQKVLLSTKGPNGGFGMGKDSMGVSLYDVVSIIDGEDFFTNCLISSESCATHHASGQPCPVHKRFSEARAKLAEFYKETTLEKIISDMEGYEDLIKL